MSRPEVLIQTVSNSVKRVYERPALTKFGPLAQLTQAGSAGTMEGTMMTNLMRMAT